MANFNSYEYNSLDVYDRGGSYTWTKPDDIDDAKPILVHVWGAGGSGDDHYSLSPTTAHGGGGGGLAVKLINVSALGATEPITVGLVEKADARGGTSSFGSHCSATGGNGGAFNTSNEGTSGYGAGGLGLGGDSNKRGGTGGAGYYSTTSNAGGGGGGSAPAPYGVSNGFDGGAGTSYSGGGGGGIGAEGKMQSYIGGPGGGSAGEGQVTQSTSSYYPSMPGGSGIAGAAGAAGSWRVAYTTYGGACGQKGDQAVSAEGCFVLEPNRIFFGGGGGSTGCHGVVSSGANGVPGGHGGPGAGGGGAGFMSSTSYIHAGSGGILGGGGGINSYGQPGNGGNAGGGGGCGYYRFLSNQAIDDPYLRNGGPGLVVVQYARKF